MDPVSGETMYSATNDFSEFYIKLLCLVQRQTTRATRMKRFSITDYLNKKFLGRLSILLVSKNNPLFYQVHAGVYTGEATFSWKTTKDLIFVVRMRKEGVSDLAQHFLMKANISVIRRIRKTDNN